ncbi:MAG: cytochrome b [Caulobacteraceae bacterium]
MSAATEAAPHAVKPRLSGYSSVAIALHWTIALLMLTNIGLAWYFNTLKGLAQVAPLGLHKSIGITVLLLTLVRIGWRLANPSPPLPASMPLWERWLAKAAHLVFYGLMLGMPLSGWAMVSASPLIKVYPTVLYGLVHWPALPFPGLGSDQLHDAGKLFRRTHNLLAWVAYVTIALHVLAALKHQFFDRDEVVGRMIPLFRRKAGAAS